MKTIISLTILTFVITISFSLFAQPSPVLQRVTGLPPSQGKIQIVLSAVSKDICWGCNYTNTQFIRTTDGGTNWTVSTVINDDNLVCGRIAAINADTAFVVMHGSGTNHGIYKTSDGGLTWTRYANAYNDVSSDPIQIYFFDSINGVSVGQPVGGNWEIYTTSNGGTDWTRVPSANIPKPQSGEVTIYDYPGSANGIDNSFWFGTFSPPTEYGTSDRGKRWFVTSNILSGHPATVAFKDSLNGIAQNFRGLLSITSDGGHTWQPVQLRFSSPSPMGLAYIKGTDNSYLMDVAYNKRTSSEPTNPGTAYSSDGGRTWEVINKLPNQWPSFAPDGTGWSAGINDSVYKWTGFSSTGTALDTGFWHFTLHYSDGSLWYRSIAQYYSDGTEMEDAATPPVKPAHVCMGVWKQSGDTVKIYHIIYMYNGNDTLPPSNYAELRETNKLDPDGDSLNGTFDVKVYDINNGNQVQEIKGTTNASRIDFQEPFSLFSKVTGVNDGILAPTKYALSQNYPNPFNPTTTIKYTIPKAEHVVIKVYDILGKLVQTLVDSQLSKGIHKVQFNGSNLSSGIYFYQLKAGNFKQAKKMIVLK